LNVDSLVGRFARTAILVVDNLGIWESPEKGIVDEHIRFGLLRQQAVYSLLCNSSKHHHTDVLFSLLYSVSPEFCSQVPW